VESSFDVLNDYLTIKKILQEKSYGVTMDKERSLTGKMKALSAMVKALSSVEVCSHHYIYRQNVTTQYVSPCLQNTLNEVVKTVNHIKSCVLSNNLKW
jgi:hypothetical protein